MTLKYCLKHPSSESIRGAFDTREKAEKELKAFKAIGRLQGYKVVKLNLKEPTPLTEAEKENLSLLGKELNKVVAVLQ